MVLKTNKNCISTRKRMKLDFYLTKFTKIFSKCTRGLSLRAKTVKLLEENIGEDFMMLDVHKSKKQKLDKLDFIKIKNICRPKCTDEESKIETHRMG
jgi:hypothetical protein